MSACGRGVEEFETSVHLDLFWDSLISLMGEFSGHTFNLKRLQTLDVPRRVKQYN